MRQQRLFARRSPLPSKKPSRPLLRRAIILLLLLLLAWLGWKGWRIATLAQATYQDMQALQQLDRSQPEAALLNNLQERLSDTREHVVALRAEAALFLPLTPLLDWVPTYGTDIAAAEPLLDVAVNMTIAADETAIALSPLLEDIQRNPTPDEVLTITAQLASARPHLERAQQAMEQARASWEQVPVATLSPEVRPLLQRVEPLLPLLQASIDLALAADETTSALIPALFDETGQLQSSDAALQKLDKAQPQIEQAQRLLARASASLDGVLTARLPAAVQQRLQEAKAMLPLADDGLTLARLLPDLLGVDGRQEYLLINQNPDELRPTGGFVGSAGPLVFEHGQLVEHTIEPTDDFIPGTYPPPPAALQRYMNLSLWIFRDANWSPDFPTAAQKMLELYKIERGHTFTNVIAIDPAAVRILLHAIGPVVVEDAEEPVTAENVQQYMYDEYNRGVAQADVGKKDFINKLMLALVAKLETDFTTLDPLALLHAFSQALNTRHILFYVAHPDTAMLLAEKGWNGAVEPGTHDFLMAVGANVGYNKVNASIRQSVTYEVDLHNPAAPEATLTVQNRNTVETPVECRYGAGLAHFSSYDDSTIDCYWNYLRILIPRHSHVISWDTTPIPGAWVRGDLEDDFRGDKTLSGDGPASTYVLSTLVVVAPGGEHTMNVRYRLPPSVVTRTAEGWHYRLRIQKQPGLEAPPHQVHISLPADATHISSSHVPDTQTHSSLTFSFDLEHDYFLDVWFHE